MTERQTRFCQGFVALLGVFSFAIILASRHITDGDLWSHMTVGSAIWEKGRLLRHDIFAFTPTLPDWINHEWGSAAVFYGMTRTFGPDGLMLLKIALALGGLGFAFATGRKQGCAASALFLIALAAAACIFPGYIPTLRSHAFTFCFFGLTLYCLEELRTGAVWPAFALPGLVLFWANLHGGFVSGLAIILLYTAGAIVTRRRGLAMAITAAACVAVTFINPYGVKFWQYLIPALLQPRARITEWQPLPFLAWDYWWGFRILFALTVLAIGIGWRKVERKNYYGLAVLALTACMGWHVRRHGPFLGIAALAFAGPYFQGALALAPSPIRQKCEPAVCALAVYIVMAFVAVIDFLPQASLQPLAPAGEDPVRETDILSLAGAKGNLAAPFDWGSYLTWRLFPNIKVSMDGRYETAYPESSFQLNAAFDDHAGGWFKLCREFKVDYVILDLRTHPLRPADLIAKGYVLIWKQDGVSALLCLAEHAAALEKTARALPPYTIDPLDLKTRPATLFPRTGFPR